MAASVVVWDQVGDPPAGRDEVLCWRSYAHGDSIASVPPQFEFTFKPHPGYSVDLAKYPGLKAAETGEPLAQILAEL